MQHAQPDDTIEVYSSTYHEHDIIIEKQGLTLQGVPHEQRSGNDIGKSVVTSTDNFTIFDVQDDDVTITGFVIIDGTEWGWAMEPIQIDGNNCTFSYNNVTRGMMTL